MQQYPGEPNANTARMLTTLAALVSGIVPGKSCQLSAIARKAPDRVKADSRIKRYSRWIQNERIEYESDLLYGKRALPITWLVVKGHKGHLSEHVHLQLLGQVHDILPPDARTIFLGDGEFDGIELQAAFQTMGWQYVCHTVKNTQLYEDDHLFAFTSLANPNRSG